MLRRVLHPPLIAAFPVIFLFSQNAEWVRPGKVVWPLLTVVASTIALLTLGRLLFGDLRRAGITASMLALLFLSYGHVWTGLAGKSFAGMVFGRDLFLIPLWAVLGTIAVVFARCVQSLDEVTRAFNAAALALIAFSLFSAGTAVRAHSTPASPRLAKGATMAPTIEGRSLGTQRDVYYLVFDRYARGDILRQHYSFDNSHFISFLQSKGFYVADQSVSNYPKTPHSLAASLNMRYLDGLSTDPGQDSSDWGPLFRMMSGSDVARFFQAQGYRYVHIGGWWEPTSHDPSADVSYRYSRRSEFTRALLQTTLIHPAAKRLGFLEELDFRRVTYNEALFQFETVLDTPKQKGPSFVFAHFLVPHEPFRFDRDGRYVTENQQRARQYETNYTDQLVFTNRRIMELVDRLLDVPEDQKPIIIIQSDEGPQPFGIEWGGGSTRWTKASDTALKIKFSILNAYYLPDIDQADLYPTITPVNSFRVLLRNYFGSDLDLLPDRSFIYVGVPQPYVFEEVSDRISANR